MNQDLKDYILYLIKNSFVHSTTVDGKSIYIIGKTLSDYDFIITVKYSHTTHTDIYYEYELYSDLFPVYKITLPLNQPIQKDDTLAQDFLTILKKCSDKIKYQESLAQKNMFLRTFANTANELEY